MAGIPGLGIPGLQTLVIQVHAPTETAEDSEKDEFYSQLQDSLDHIPSYDIKLLIGDFNAQIDSDRRGQNVAVGLHGTAKETAKNGERLTSLCVNNGLKIENTFFQHKDTSLIVSTVIYASETRKSTARICQQLDVFHQRNLRKILGITWKDNVTNMEVLSRMGSEDYRTL